MPAKLYPRDLVGCMDTVDRWCYSTVPTFKIKKNFVGFLDLTHPLLVSCLGGLRGG